MGYLYNKEAILEYILSKKPKPEFPHISKLSDIFEVNFIDNPSFKEPEEQNTTYDESMPTRFICCVTNEELTGAIPVVAIKSCGCVMLQKALKEIKSSKCLNCGKTMKQSDIILLNPSPEEAQIKLKELLEEKQRKEEKKRKLHPEEKSNKKAKIVKEIEPEEPKVLISSSLINQAKKQLEEDKKKSGVYDKIFKNLSNQKTLVRGGEDETNLFIRTTTGRYTL